MTHSENQISLTKGIFIPSPPCRPNSTKKQKDIKSSHESLHYIQYKATCNSIEKQIQEIERTAYKGTFDALVKFVKEYDLVKVTEAVEIPSAILVMGVNMPDHSNIFCLLENELNLHGLCATVKLQSKDCSTFFNLMQVLVPGIINKYQKVLGGVDVIMKKADCTFSKLLSFYESLPYLKPSRNAKKSLKKSGKEVQLKMDPIVILIEDVEAFDLNVLQVLILNCHMYVNKLPIVLLFGMASAMVTLHDLLSQKVIACLSIETFCSFTAIEYLTKIVQEVLLSVENPFKLGPKVFRLLTDTVLYHDFSVTNLNHMLKMCILEHFYDNDIAFLCCPEFEISKNVQLLSKDQLEKIRNLPSVKRYLEENPQCKTDLKTRNDFTALVEKLLKDLHSYYRNFMNHLNCLHALTKDLPGSPFGKQIREIYPLALESQLTSSPAYQQATKLLKMQSKDELISKLQVCLQVVSNQGGDSDMKDVLGSHVEALEQLTEADFEKQTTVSDSNGLEKVTSRAQLQQKLMLRLKSSASKFENCRESIINFFTSSFQKMHLPSELPLHELFYFDDHLVIRNYLMAVPRITLHHDLIAPKDHLKCICCNVKEGELGSLMPDICTLYKLHLECGKLINLCDWLEAFKASKEEWNLNNESSCNNAHLNIRFMHAVSELQYLGFIKSTKKKTDHVARLTFGSF